MTFLISHDGVVYQKRPRPGHGAARPEDDPLRSGSGVAEGALTPATRSRKLPDRVPRETQRVTRLPKMRPMSSLIRCIATFLVVMMLCTVAGAQTAAPQTAAPEVTLKSLRALTEQIPKSADSEEELGSVGTLTNHIVAQAERFVAARTTQLADLNARLGELGPAPTEGGNTENPDVTRQRAALEKERNALDADIRLARLMSVNAQQRRAEVLAQRRAVFEAQLLKRSDSPLRAAFWDQASAQWQDRPGPLAHPGRASSSSGRQPRCAARSRPSF